MFSLFISFIVIFFLSMCFDVTTTTASNTIQYEIIDYKFDQLKEDIERLNKRAKRLHCKPIEIIIISERNEEKKSGYIRKWYTIEIKGETPQYKGWSFIGIIQHIDDVKIIKSIPGEEIPLKYRDRGAICDHCQVNRYRKDTFIIRHDNNEYKQVGRQCLKDFLGHDNPHNLAAQAEILIQVSDLACMYSEVEDYIDDVNRGPKSAQYKYFSLAQYLSWVISIVNNRGYFVSRSKASYEQQATCDIAQDLMFPIWGKMSAREKDYRESIEPGEKEIETAHRAIEWAESLIDNNEDVNDYLYNISSIAKLKAIDFNLIGYAASIYPAYNKAMEKKEESEISNYVGTIGKRENFTVTLEKVLTFENHYGLIYFYLFKDLTGNKLVWKTNTGINDLEINIPVAIKATIKKHEIKYDCKQTVINRVVLI